VQILGSAQHNNASAEAVVRRCPTQTLLTFRVCRRADDRSELFRNTPTTTTELAEMSTLTHYTTLVSE